MKHIMLTLGIAAGMAGSPAAQTLSSAPAHEMRQDNQDRMKQKLSPEEKARKDAGRAEKELGLNSDQKARWETASLERTRANQPLREKMNGSTTPAERKALRDQMKTNHQKYNETVTALLTPDQKARYEQMKKERKESHKGKKGQGPRHHGAKH
jgi:protein CpxP